MSKSLNIKRYSLSWNAARWIFALHSLGLASRIFPLVAACRRCLELGPSVVIRMPFVRPSMLAPGADSIGAAIPSV